MPLSILKIMIFSIFAVAFLCAIPAFSLLSCPPSVLLPYSSLISFGLCPPISFPPFVFSSIHRLPQPPFVLSTSNTAGRDGHSAEGVFSAQSSGQLHQPDAGGQGARGGREHRWEEENQQGISDSVHLTVPEPIKWFLVCSKNILLQIKVQ